MPLKDILYRTLRAIAQLRAQRDEPNCILVLQYLLPLGGCVHATPMYAALRRSLPHLPVYVVTRGLGAQVLRHNPDIAGILETPDAFTSLHAAGRSLARQLREHKLVPAWIVTDATNRRSSLALLGALYVHAPLVGYNLAASLQTVSLALDKSESMLANNLAIAAAIGAGAQHIEPRIFFSTADANDARSLLRSINPDGLPIAIFSTQSSGGQPSQWHEDRFQAVIAAIAERGLLPVCVGTADQSSAIDALRSAVDVATASLAGKTDISTLAAVLALSDLCISIDTGTMHLARAVGVPLVVLAPTYQPAIEWLPLDLPQARVLRGGGTAPVPPTYRLDEVHVPAVLAAVEDLLTAFPPSAASREARVAALTNSVTHQATS